MASIRYRIELNPLTNPASYKLRFMPQSTAGYDEVAARVALKNPGLSAEAVKTALMGSMEEISIMMSEGMQVTLENACTFRPSLHARLESPEDPLPPIDELLEITISASRPYTAALRQNAHLECVPADEKTPVILAATDTVLELNDVLNSTGMLRLSGSGLFFDKKKPDCGCVIAGTRSGEEKQTQFGPISDTEFLLVPHIPAQDEAWNNEYTVTVTTQYTENGSLRSGTYRRRLRTPLTVDLGSAGESGVGILTGDAVDPYVWLVARTGSGAEELRIQAVLDLGADTLTLSLLAMQENAATGPAIGIADNGSYTLPGFSGSAVSSITVQVSYLTELKTLVRSAYQGRMVDVLDVVG